MSEREKEHERGDDESSESEGQQEEAVNDPLTRSDTEAPKVPWGSSPE